MALTEQKLKKGEVYIDQLKPGTAIMSGQVAYRLLYLTPGSAYVQRLQGSKIKIKTKSPEQDDVEWDAPGAKYHIARTTVVTIISDADPEFDYDKSSDRTTTKKKSKGGKPAADKLIIPVTPNGKRGKVLKFFMDEGGTRVLKEAQNEFKISRAHVISYMYVFWRYHGIGYEVEGPRGTVILPVGCVDPFTEQKVTKKPKSKPKPAKKKVRRKR